MHLTLPFVASLLAASIATLTGLVLLRQRDLQGAIPLLVFNLGVALWTGGNAGQLAAPTLATKLLWVNVQYVGIVMVPVAAVWFGAIIAGYEEAVTPRRLGLLALPLVVLVGLSWTNPLHSLVRTRVALTTTAGTPHLVREFGPAFWAGWVYSNLVVLGGTAFVARAVAYADRVITRRTLALLLGAAVPWFGHVLFVAGVTTIEPEPLFAVTGVAFAYSIWEFDRPPNRAPARDAILATLEEGVLVLDETGHVVDLNSAVRELLDCEQAVIVGQPLESVLDEMPGVLEAYRDDGSQGPVEVTTAAGTSRHLRVRTTAVDRELGHSHQVLVLQDVTELKANQAELERKNARLEKFASVLSHDLRNPLNVAVGHLEMAQSDEDDDHLDAVATAHDRIETLISDMETLTRAGQAIDTQEPVALDEACQTAWQQVHAPEATLEISTSARILADQSRLLQLLENLFCNAVEHGGADVTVTVERIPDGFAVADDGHGIPEADRADVFTAGHSGTRNGSGIGLSIVLEIAEAHDWSITVDASASGGASFEITGVEQTESTTVGPSNHE